MITTVSYAKLFNLGNYENHRIEATYQLDADEPPTTGLIYLRDWVESAHLSLINADREHRQTERDIAERELRLDSLNQQIRGAEERWSAAKLWLEKIGAGLPGFLDTEDIPF